MKNLLIIISAFIFSSKLFAQENPVIKDSVALHVDRKNNDTIIRTYSNPERIPNTTTNDGSGKMSNSSLNRTNPSRKKSGSKNGTRRDTLK